MTGPMVAETSNTSWWEAVSLEPGTTARWRIGGLRLAVYRSAREWLLSTEEVEELEEPDWSLDRLDQRPEETDDVERHVFRQTDDRIRLRPALADRPIVTSPRIPLYVPPGEEATLYVGSPLWIEVETGDPPRTLRELPLRRPSDTWFGPDTREGELCYATRTRAALDLGNLPRTGRRVTTALQIRNQADTPLRVEKVKLPVPLLSVFDSPSTGLLWTETVTMVRRGEAESADLEVHDSPPPEAGNTTLLTEPRERPERGLLTRAVGSLFR